MDRFVLVDWPLRGLVCHCKRLHRIPVNLIWSSVGRPLDLTTHAYTRFVFDFRGVRGDFGEEEGEFGFVFEFKTLGHEDASPRSFPLLALRPSLCGFIPRVQEGMFVGRRRIHYPLDNKK